MSRWSVNSAGKVVQCGLDCKCEHEHYVGSYEMAVKYFCVDEDEIKSYGNLLHIVVAHQTMPQFAPKLSNELYEILIQAQAEKKYWSPVEQRHERALKAIEDGEKLGVVNDSKLLEKLEKSERMQSQKRVYMYRRWESTI